MFPKLSRPPRNRAGRTNCSHRCPAIRPAGCSRIFRNLGTSVAEDGDKLKVERKRTAFADHIIKGRHDLARIALDTGQRLRQKSPVDGPLSWSNNSPQILRLQILPVTLDGIAAGAQFAFRSRPSHPKSATQGHTGFRFHGPEFFQKVRVK